MYITGITHSSQAFRYITYMDTNYNVQLYMAHSPCFYLPLLTPLCFPLCPLFESTLLTWNPPSCDRIRPPQSQVACKLTPLDPTLLPTLPSPNSPNPNTPRLTKTTSGITRHLLSGTIILKGVFTKIMKSRQTVS